MVKSIQNWLMESAIKRTRREGIRLGEQLAEAARKNYGITPVEVLESALRDECGFPRYPRERMADYTARAAMISREQYEAYRSLVGRGKRVPAEFAELEAFLSRVGRRCLQAIEAASLKNGAALAKPNRS